MFQQYSNYACLLQIWILSIGLYFLFLLFTVSFFIISIYTSPTVSLSFHFLPITLAGGVVRLLPADWLPLLTSCYEEFGRFSDSTHFTLLPPLASRFPRALLSLLPLFLYFFCSLSLLAPVVKVFFHFYLFMYSYHTIVRLNLLIWLFTVEFINVLFLIIKFASF